MRDRRPRRQKVKDRSVALSVPARGGVRNERASSYEADATPGAVRCSRTCPDGSRNSTPHESLEQPLPGTVGPRRWQQADIFRRPDVCVATRGATTAQSGCCRVGAIPKERGQARGKGSGVPTFIALSPLGEAKALARRETGARRSRPASASRVRPQSPPPGSGFAARRLEERLS